MEQSLIQKIKEGLYLDGLDPKSYSPLSLAYIGDAIYEIVIRTIVMSAGNMSVNKSVSYTHLTLPTICSV